MKIYTKTGDKGKTSLYSGQRVNKDDKYIKAIGSVDEANCFLGLAISLLDQNKLPKVLEQLVTVQNTLFIVGAALATPRSTLKEGKRKETEFSDEAAKLLETWIDEHEASLPPLKNFILPGGSSPAAALHTARAIVRRAERDICPLLNDEEVSENLFCYINRLSDYLFVITRVINKELGIAEIIWQN